MGEILKIVKECESFLISSHINPDGDAIGSQLAFYSLLLDLGKKVILVNSDPVPPVYSFLPGANVFCSATDSCDERFWKNAEVAVILDCGNLDRIGERLASQIRPKSALINIDHHSSNNYFGTHNLVDVNACATAELVFNLIKYNGMKIGQDRATCLYTAIITDTGCFKYMNTSAKAHRIVAQLIDEGIRPDRIAELVYEVIPYRKAKLFGMALETLQLSCDARVAWMSITNEMYERTGAGSADTDGFVEYVRSLKDTEIAILFREIENGNVKVSLRSKSDFNVDQIAARFGGGGHQMAAGCVISKPLNEAIGMVVEVINRQMERMNSSFN